MAAGVIPYSSLPSPVPTGLLEACEAALQAAGFQTFVTRAPDGVHVADVATVNATIASYVGSAAELAYHRNQQQTALDDFFNAHFDLAAFIRGGSATGVTAANVGTFLATITNNYRSLRAQIAAAANVAAVSAINIAGGWPSNP